MNNPSQDPQTLFQEGVRAIRDRRDLTLGRKLLTQSLKLDPNNDAGWVWLAQVVTDQNRRLQCLNRALEINPDNAQAMELRQRLQSETTLDDSASTARPPQPEKNRTSTSEFAAVPAALQGDGNVIGGIDTARLGKVVLSSSLNQSHQFFKIMSLIGCVYLSLSVLLSRQSFDDIWSPLILIAGVLFSLGAIYLFIDCVMAFGQKLTLTEGGLILVRGGKTHAWGWDEFTAVKVSESRTDLGGAVAFRFGWIGILLYYTLLKNRLVAREYAWKLFIGKKVVVKVNRNYEHSLEVGQLIEKATSRALLEKYQHAYKRGDTLEFGKINLSRAMFICGQDRIPWRSIFQCRVEYDRQHNRKMLIVETREKIRRFILNNLPNVRVLILMLEEITGQPVFVMDSDDDTGSPRRRKKKKGAW